MNETKLKEILDKHSKWLRDEEGGAKANLRCADLRDANLRCAKLRGADLCGVSYNEHTAFLRSNAPKKALLSGTKKQMV